MIDTNNFLGLGWKENETMPWGSKYNLINVRGIATDINKALVHSSLTPCLMPPSFLRIGVLKIWILENCVNLFTGMQCIVLFLLHGIVIFKYSRYDTF